jgi:hypothetical protein
MEGDGIATGEEDPTAPRLKRGTRARDHGIRQPGNLERHEVLFHWRTCLFRSRGLGRSMCGCSSSSSLLDPVSKIAPLVKDTEDVRRWVQLAGCRASSESSSFGAAPGSHGPRSSVRSRRSSFSSCPAYNFSATAHRNSPKQAYAPLARNLSMTVPPSSCHLLSMTSMQLLAR